MGFQEAKKAKELSVSFQFWSRTKVENLHLKYLYLVTLVNSQSQKLAIHKLPFPESLKYKTIITSFIPLMFQAGKSVSEALELEKYLSSLIKERGRACSLGDAASARGALRYLHSPWLGEPQEESKPRGQVLHSNSDSAVSLTLGHFCLTLFPLQ